VKCGRGGYTIHQNAHFLAMCGANAEDYAAAPKGRHGKRRIAMKIVHAIQARQGRFIIENDGGQWLVLSMEAARNKTAHCIRDINLKRCKNA
jgi:hypothetical protein